VTDRRKRHEGFKRFDARLYAWEQAHPVLTWLLAIGIVLVFFGLLWAFGFLR
jgi:hypothetical protein